mgnify:CR=1 FL=1
MALPADGENVRHRRDEERVVGHDGRPVDRREEFDLRDELFFAAGLEDDEFAILGASVELAVTHERRRPDAAVRRMHPEFLARPGVEAVDVAVVFRLKDEVVGDARR